jgi:hypothetical protein
MRVVHRECDSHRVSEPPERGSFGLIATRERDATEQRPLGNLLGLIIGHTNGSATRIGGAALQSEVALYRVRD